MDKYHAEILKAIKKYQGQDTKLQHCWNQNYIGSTKHSYQLKAEVSKQIAKNWIKTHPKLSLMDYIKLLDSLSLGRSHEEISMIGRLLGYAPKLRKQLQPENLDKWLGQVQGWAEVDSICQSNFTSNELLNNWPKWQKMINKFSKDKNVHKRRASLVLLVKSAKQVKDNRLSKIAFLAIDRLKNEKDILITKAISWLLRSMIKNYRQEVEGYLKKNENDLPKIAVRETTRKLLTGKK